MSFSGSSPSTIAAASGGSVRGGRRIGSKTKYFAPAASRMPSNSWISSVRRLAWQAVELLPQSLELGGRGVSPRARDWGGRSRPPGPPTPHQQQHPPPPDDPRRRKEIPGQGEGAPGGSPQRHF